MSEASGNNEQPSLENGLNIFGLLAQPDNSRPIASISACSRLLFGKLAVLGVLKGMLPAHAD